MLLIVPVAAVGIDDDTDGFMGLSEVLAFGVLVNSGDKVAEVFEQGGGADGH